MPPMPTSTALTTFVDPGMVKANLGTVLNQALSQEIPVLSEAELGPLRERYVRIEGDEPLDVTEVSNAQLSALKAVVDQGLPPYADFGVWAPHGNRLARKQKFTSMHVDPSGKWRTTEQTGPPHLDAWRTSWAVFASASIMLGIATPATLARYERRFVERCQRYPRAWHIAVVAEDRCRAEFWGAERRRQERFFRLHPTMSAVDVTMPWESILKESATNLEWWTREFQEPALLFTRERAEVAPSWVAQQLPEERGEKRPWSGKGGGQGGMQGHPRSNGGVYSTTRQGLGLCRQFQTNECMRTTCKFAHSCELCLGNHAKLNCTVGGKAPPKGRGRGKGGKKKGKGKAAE